MLRDVIALGAGAVALFYGALFVIGGAWFTALVWFVLWFVVLLLDFQLWRETAPPPPVVQGEPIDP